jgi:hypothetical protein
LVVFALSASALLAMIGLLYSIGLVLAERRSLQTAADSASLRGAWQVLVELQQDEPGDVLRDGRVRAQILGYAASNGATNAADVSAVYVTGAGVALASTVGGGVLPSEARGVLVTVRGVSQTILPGLVGRQNVLVATSASAAASPSAPSPPAPETRAMPIAVHLNDAVAAYRDHTEYDLFDPSTAPFDLAPTLDLTSVGAPAGAPLSTNLQYWSDGQHNNGTVSIGGTVRVAGTEDFDDVAAGLRDNIRRQGLYDSTGAAYGIFALPIWSGNPLVNGVTTSSWTGDPQVTVIRVNVVGFTRLKILLSAIDADGTSARGFFVPYPVAAFGVLTPPTADLGGALVRILS